MAYPYLSEEDNLADLNSRIPGSDRETFLNYGHLRIEPAFDRRLFVVFKPAGLTATGQHRDPEILTTIKVLSLRVDSVKGASCTITDQISGARTDLTYIPHRVFGYDLFMSVPPVLRLRWDAREHDQGIDRSLAYGLLIKTKNRSDFYSAGNTYIETPNRFRGLFPNADLRLNQI